jgi:membrane-associated protein
MASLLDQLIQFVSAHPYLAYATVFVAALLEAVPIVGSFVPGSSMIIGLSAFVAAGELDLAGVLASAIAGAVIGDGTAFLLGYLYQRQILEIWPLKNYPNVIARSEAFFQDRGTLAVLFARFVPPVRAFVPVTAGALGMAPMRFYPINIIAIALWACAHVLPGALAGTLWKQYGRQIEHIVLPALAIIIVMAVIVWLVRRRRALTTG